MNFLNTQCPVCNNTLSVYLHVFNTCLLKGTIDCDSYKFTPFDLIKYPFNKKDHFIISNSFDIDYYSHNGDYSDLSRLECNIFYICNPKNIYNEYDSINFESYNICYLAHSPSFNIKLSNDKYFVNFINDISIPIINETISLNKKDNNFEKNYILSLDHLNNETILWYYLVSDNQLKNNTSPDVFTKTFNHLAKRLPLNDKEKLLSKLDSWITMS